VEVDSYLKGNGPESWPLLKKLMQQGLGVVNEGHLVAFGSDYLCEHAEASQVQVRGFHFAR
jgi:hypothetical protein